jgi:hypothetical protein
MLHQDVSSTEMLFKSGKIKTGNYILALMESEQILVDMKGRFFAYLQSNLQYLANQQVLTDRLSPLPSQEQ